MNDAAQRKCFTVFCRNLQNGIGLIHGPGGTGKTLMVAALAESASEQGRKVLIMTSQNSASDSTIEKFSESQHMVVRAHALGLERRSMLQSQATASKAEDHNEGKVNETKDQDGDDTKDIPEQSNDSAPAQDTNLDAAPKDQSPAQKEGNFPDQDTNPDEAPDIHMIDIMMRANADFMRGYEDIYIAKDSVLRPVDPRMQKVQFAIHTWMLKLAGIVPSKWSQQPTAQQVATGVRDEWVQFRALWSRQKIGRIEDQEWDDFKKAFSRLATEVVQRADIIACTPAVQVKGFDAILNVMS